MHVCEVLSLLVAKPPSIDGNLYMLLCASSGGSKPSGEETLPNGWRGAAVCVTHVVSSHLVVRTAL
jgi:hypothetical protein